MMGKRKAAYAARGGEPVQQGNYQTESGTIRYYTNRKDPGGVTLVFLPGLTADHRLFDKQVEYFAPRYNVLVWD